jgi:hypothetical protein
MEMTVDKAKWNAACDILIEMVNRPIDGNIRNEVREELCCSELDQVKTEVSDFLRGMRK